MYIPVIQLLLHKKGQQKSPPENRQLLSSWEESKCVWSQFEEYPDGENIPCNDQSHQYTKTYIPETVPRVKIHFAGHRFSFDLPWKQTFTLKSELKKLVENLGSKNTLANEHLVFLNDILLCNLESS